MHGKRAKLKKKKSQHQDASASVDESEAGLPADKRVRAESRDSEKHGKEVGKSSESWDTHSQDSDLRTDIDRKAETGTSTSMVAKTKTGTSSGSDTEAASKDKDGGIRKVCSSADDALGRGGAKRFKPKVTVATALATPTPVSVWAVETPAGPINDTSKGNATNAMGTNT